MFKPVFLFCLLLLAFSASGPDLRTPFEKSSGNYSASYEEAIAWYKKLDSAYKNVKMLTYGMTDAGKPLTLVVVSSDADFDPQSIRRHNRRIIMVLNAIHPGEPEGVDASMMLARDAVNKKEIQDALGSNVLIIIPAYNIGGMLNRGRFSRANQDGPEEYGFRGNSENLDLNRDFIKCDSKNARAFTAIFREWEPDMLLDNHTSDGADYQYTLTYISNDDGLSPSLADYVKNRLTPAINGLTTKDGFELCPYVETIAAVPDSGITGFVSEPRYSAGYAALYNCISYTVETHMLKPFSKRLEATYSFMKACLIRMRDDSKEVGELRARADYDVKGSLGYVVSWDLDTSKYDWITFKGYKASYKPSEVSGLQRLWYDRSQPYEKKVKFYDYSRPLAAVERPAAYIIPQAWWQVIELMKLNKVNMQQLRKDTTLPVEMYYIEGFENQGRQPYEGHYLHSDVKIRRQQMLQRFHEGDYVIWMNQSANRYILETLEPQAPDAFFNWNFFDPILQQKEYFSSYVFEDKAAELLRQNPDLKRLLDEKKKTDVEFAKNARAQLQFIYERSPYFEPSFKQYPVGRFLQNTKLDVK